MTTDRTIKGGLFSTKLGLGVLIKKLGIKNTKQHCVFHFAQSPWLPVYISYNAGQAAKKNKFELFLTN